jgi:hypothetical protein
VFPLPDTPPVVEPPPIKPPIKPPVEPITPPVKPEVPHMPKPQRVAFKREYDPPRYLGFNDARDEVLGHTDLADTRTHLELTVYYQPGEGSAGPGMFGWKNKVVVRSQEDQLCVNSDGIDISATLNQAGMFDIRPGTFPNTFMLGVPAQERAVRLSNDGIVEIADLASAGADQFSFKVVDADEKSSTYGKDLTIPF